MSGTAVNRKHPAKTMAFSARNAFNNRYTWRSLRSNSCAAARTGRPPRSTSRNTSRRRNSPSLMLSTAIDATSHSRQKAAETDIFKLGQNRRERRTLSGYYVLISTRGSEKRMLFLLYGTPLEGSDQLDAKISFKPMA